MAPGRSQLAESDFARLQGPRGLTMLFCLSVCDETHRVILDQDYYGEVLAMIEGRDWQEARQGVDTHPALDAFTYRAGWGWH